MESTKFILQGELDDEEELLSRVADILEDSAKNKISFKKQFKCFVEAKEKQEKYKKVRVTTPPEVNSIDLNSTPPPPYPTKIVQEEIPNPTVFSSSNPYIYVMPKILKENFDKDADLQQFINDLPNIFCNSQQINNTHSLTKSSSS